MGLRRKTCIYIPPEEQLLSCNVREVLKPHRISNCEKFGSALRELMRSMVRKEVASLPPLHGAQTSSQKGGWITFPFIIGSIFGFGLSMSGATSNMMVYLIKEYNVKSIDAAQIYNVINGCLAVTPVAGAIVSDAFFGCYRVVVFSSVVSVLASLLFTLTAAQRSLRPTPCAMGSDACKHQTAGQEAALYGAVALMAVAVGGSRFTMAAMGANQFDKARDKDVFFNWFFIVLYGSTIVGSTAIVYIQDNVSWTLGFGLTTVSSAIGAVIFLLGTKHYRRPPSEGSPFTGLARVLLAAIRKKNVVMLPENVHYYYAAGEGAKEISIHAPTQSLSFLNRAAVITEGDMSQDGSIARPWRLCTVQQVEDLKTLIRILPLWSSSIFLSISIGIQISLTILQALAMNRSLGPRFVIPAGSMLVSAFASTIVSLFFLDRILFPMWSSVAGGRGPTTFQRIGLGHVVNVAAMAVSALVERWREGLVRAHGAEGTHGWVAPMSALWLVLPFAIAGLGEALHFPGQVALYYNEFPRALQNTATGMVALIVALGFYLSTTVVDLVRRATSWLPDNINASRMENVYWMLAVLCVINFGYFVVCAKLYKCRISNEEGAAEDVVCPAT